MREARPGRRREGGSTPCGGLPRVRFGGSFPRVENLGPAVVEHPCRMVRTLGSDIGCVKSARCASRAGWTKRVGNGGPRGWGKISCGRSCFAAVNQEGSARARGVAQPGRAPALGAGSRQFESGRPDHLLSEAWLQKYDGWLGDGFSHALLPSALGLRIFGGTGGLSGMIFSIDSSGTQPRVWVAKDM